MKLRSKPCRAARRRCARRSSRREPNQTNPGVSEARKSSPTSCWKSALALYQRFPVAEVRFWRKGKLEVHALLADGSGYERVEQGSRWLAGLDLALLERCVAIPGWREARRVFRAGLAAGQ